MRLTVLHPGVSPRHRLWQRVAGESAAVAGVFCAVVALVLVYAGVSGRAGHPLDESLVPGLKARLAKEPGNEGLKEEIRASDRRLREAYFRRRAFVAQGAWLLAGAAAVWAVALGFSKSLARRAYLPGEPVDVSGTTGRAAVGVGGTILLAGLVVAAVMGRDGRRGDVGAVAVASTGPAVAAAVAPPATAEEFARNWAGFRGSAGYGVAPEGVYPVAWDGVSGKGIVWKAPVAAAGNNSPVVWGERLFMSGATADAREVICVNATDGAVVWRSAVKGSASAAKPKVSDDTGHAPSTVAVDGRHVYAIYPTGELVALDFAGKPVWQKSLGVPDNLYGHASSLRAWGGAVFVQYDQGHAEKGSLSALYAFDGATGKELWKASRPVQSAWSTPIVIDAGGPARVVVAGNPLLTAHDAASGVEVWRAKVLGGEVAPSPAFAGGVVYTANTGASVSAVRADGAGDVTATHRLWKNSDGLPDIVSPLATGPFVFTVTTDGLVTCFETAKGKVAWEQELEATFHASPVLAGGVVYLTDTTGVTHVFKAAGAYEAVGKCELGEEVVGTPAFAGGRIYVRGKQNLYCIGGTP